MCRMLLMRSPKESLFNALIAAAVDDPLGAKRWGNKREPNHPDGWGFVSIADDSIVEYRSPLPIWKDEKGLGFYKNNMGMISLVHVRKTSIKGTEKYTQNIQPVNMANVVWIGYNGTISPENLDAPDPLKKMMKKGVLADTAAVAWAVLESYSEEPLTTAMSLKGWLEENVPEGSGAAVFFLDSQGNAGYAWECKCEDPELSYYKIYLYEEGDTKAVASSTVALKHGGNWKEAPEYGVL
ncbi:hypothetical protein IPA_00075 [Ignicoccus pacificus DSM 13166]|uniref:Glutamine amidotransferase type-2 domain-containing protein n=1 Tax=Ignicoccus pacificus DSM 13166 TaxID=940294 RepID=A0A977PKG2_9CREN|nr:hypothetical protein IPA_00075 [Ignicoccus pacificus DSM 13166]